MALTNKCDWGVRITYDFVIPVLCTPTVTSVDWDPTVLAGYYCSINGGTSDLVFAYGDTCFDDAYPHQIKVYVTNVNSGSVTVTLDTTSPVTSTNLGTITSDGVYNYIITGVGGAANDITLTFSPNTSFDGCIKEPEIYRSANTSVTFPEITGISIDGTFSLVSPAISLDPAAVAALQAWVDGLGISNTVSVNVQSTYTDILFNQTTVKPDYIQLNNADGSNYYFASVNCLSFPISQWTCCYSTLMDKLMKSEQYFKQDARCLYTKALYVKAGIDMLNGIDADNTCLVDADITNVVNNINSICCDCCQNITTVSSDIWPPSNINICQDLEGYALNVDPAVVGDVCAGSFVDFWVTGDIYETGLVYIWEQATGCDENWYPAIGYGQGTPFFQAGPISDHLCFRVRIQCSALAGAAEFVSDPEEITVSSDPTLYVGSDSCYPSAGTCLICEGASNTTYGTWQVYLPFPGLWSGDDVGGPGFIYDPGATVAWVGPDSFTSASFIDYTTDPWELDKQGTYCATVTWSSGCTATSCFDVDVVPRPTLTVTNIVAESAPATFDGEIHVTCTDPNGNTDFTVTHNRRNPFDAGCFPSARETTATFTGSTIITGFSANDYCLVATCVATGCKSVIVPVTVP